MQDNIHVDDLDEAEQYWIKHYNTFNGIGYNATSGGKRCNISDEARLKLSKVHKGIPKSEEHKRKLSESNKGKQMGKNNPFYGRTHSEETIKKIKNTLKGQMDGKKNPFYGKHHSEESLQKMRTNRAKQIGEAHPRCKLTEKNVLDIRKAVKNGASQRSLAIKYGVHESAIAKIIHRENWKHI